MQALRAFTGFMFIVLPLLSLVHQSRAQSAGSTLVPKVWLRADGVKASSFLWPDYSGQGLDATALQGEGPVSGKPLNFNPSFSFDGVNDYLKVPFNPEGSTGLTLFTVFASADTLERGVWGSEGTAARNTMLSTRRTLGPEETLEPYGNHENLPVISALVQHWTRTAAPTEGAFLALGSGGKTREGQPFKGRLLEFIAFDRALSFLERIQVQTYLSIKYGIPLQEGNYVSAKEAVLWHSEDNQAFSSRVTGIGRDDVFGLYQKQSASAVDTSGFLVIGAGIIAITNEKSTGKINNGDFLLWGDNGGALTTRRGVGEDSLLSLLERQWLVKPTGSTVQSLACELQVDFSLLPPDSLGYWLVVDRSGKGNFSPDNLEYFLPDSITRDGVAYFQGVHFDSDLSGSDRFSLVRAQPLLALTHQVRSPDCKNPTSGSLSFSIIGSKAPFAYSLSSQSGFSRHWEGTGEAVASGLPAGEYTLKVTDGANNITQRRFVLTMPDALVVDLGLDGQLSADKDLILDASLHIPDSLQVTYAWESNYGFRSSDPKVHITESGIYKVTVTTPEGCTFTDEITLSGTVAQRFSVQPTLVPAHGRFTVNVSLKQPSAVQLKVYDLKGKIYGQMQGEGQQEYRFTGSAPDPGLYLIVLQTPAGLETRKLLVH
jgi:hypothetical protein